MSELKVHREKLNTQILDHQDAAARIQGNWTNAELWIRNWWKAYKDWEAADTFNKAMLANRMTMRSFGSNFESQVNKQFTSLDIEKGRFYGDSERTDLGETVQEQHKTTFSRPQLVSTKMYIAKRGINSSAFSDPANFATRKVKYEQGLHDLSVKLVLPGRDIRGQSHHRGEKNPHFSFAPLSKPEDQAVIYKLIRCAKALKNTLPQLDTLIRGYRTRMTRAKLAHHYDMGTGYVAVPTPNRTDGLEYKIGYSVGNTTKLRAEETPNRIAAIVPTTMDIVRARQKEYFELNAGVARVGNEIVIAIREHAGPFPVLAVYEGNQLRCFSIDIAGKKVLNNTNTISNLGVASWC
jgi:hypothetical protein